MVLHNKYYILRHGQAVSNVGNICSSWPEKFENPLTKEGRQQIEKAALKLKNKNVELIFSSDLLRTKQTAEIVGRSLKMKPKFDERLREIDFGIFNGKPIADFQRFFDNPQEKSVKRVPNGESYQEVLERVTDFLGEINERYSKKTILIVSHQAPLLLLLGKISGYSIEKSIAPLHYVFGEKRITKGELLKVN